MKRIEKAINNIFKELGLRVEGIEGNKITTDTDEYKVLTYTVDDDKDLIVIKTQMGRTIAEKYISSYQKAFTVTID